MAVQIQIRHDSAADWGSEDPTLADGEIGFETDTGKFKIGDGSTAWSSLTYFCDRDYNDERYLIPYYGVAWDENADTYARTGNLAGVSVSQTLIDMLLPIQTKMRRCILNDSGEVVYYLHPKDSTKKEDGATASDLTGGDGQVMVEIPAFYYKYGYSGTVHTWEISPFPADGFSLHPAFIKNGENVAYRYIGAYEGIGYDDGTSTYFDGDDVGDTKNAMAWWYCNRHS